MWCMRCNKDLGLCICEDRDERIKSIGRLSLVLVWWCAICQKNQFDCRCVNPDKRRDSPT